jgi:hypothetical protein
VAANYTLTGTIQDLSGAGDQGYALITLSGYGENIPKVTGTNVIATIQYKTVCNSSGVFSVTVWGNDQLTPSTSFYRVQLFSATGPGSLPLTYRLTGGGSHNLASLTHL